MNFILWDMHMRSPPLGTGSLAGLERTIQDAQGSQAVQGSSCPHLPSAEIRSSSYSAQSFYVSSGNLLKLGPRAYKVKPVCEPSLHPRQLLAFPRGLFLLYLKFVVSLFHFYKNNKKHSESHVKILSESFLVVKILMFRGNFCFV